MKKLFVTGLVLLLPFLITYIVLSYFITFITNPFDRLLSKVLDQLHLFENGFVVFSNGQIIQVVSKLLVLAFFVVFIFIAGFVAHRFSTNVLNAWLDWFVGRIPFINKIYSASKEITTLVFAPQEEGMRQPVIVSFPSEDEKSIGLIIQNITTDAVSGSSCEFSVVLVPCVPNPTTGYLCLMPKEDIAFLDLKSEEAMKYIVSCGSIECRKPRPENPCHYPQALNL